MTEITESEVMLMVKEKERLRPTSERPIEIVIGENIQKYFEESD